MPQRIATNRPQSRGEKTRERLIAAVIDLVREQGYAATSVDQLCAHAGVTKGAFFHHYASKDELAAAAARFWGSNADNLFALPPSDDPVQRLLDYIDIRAAMMEGPVADCACLAGTMVQEVHATHPALRQACGEAILGHAASLDRDCADALAIHPHEGMTAASLARYIQAVIQGGLVMAKAGDDIALAREAVSHLRRYIVRLFNHQGI